MSQGRKFDYPPLLAPGAHYLSLPQISDLAVERFSGPSRTHRERLFYSLEEFVQVLLQRRMVGDLSVDGSFLTEKPFPSDVDVTLTCDKEFVDLCDEVSYAFFCHITDTVVVSNVDSLSVTRFYRHDRHYGTTLDVGNMSNHYGIENSERWLKGYVVLRLWETDVGRRIRG